MKATGIERRLNVHLEKLASHARLPKRTAGSAKTADPKRRFAAKTRVTFARAVCAFVWQLAL